MIIMLNTAWKQMFKKTVNKKSLWLPCIIKEKNWQLMLFFNRN
jgi:hypothetical protein